MICARGLFGSTSDGKAVCIEDAVGGAVWPGDASCASAICEIPAQAQIETKLARKVDFLQHTFIVIR